jgi:threonylcarbamoyladenosine tRNA methylthiotransferase MtaB
VNRYESEGIAEALLRSRWRGGAKGEEIDLCIINTCTVTQKANAQSRQAVRKQIRMHGDALILVTGCGVQRDPEVFAAIPGVHYIVGNSFKGQITELLKRPASLSNPVTCVEDMRGGRVFQDLPITRFGERTRCFLKIQDGCDAFCSYCVVPYVRGPSRSLNGQVVLERLQGLKTMGYDETVLCGIHMGRYGQDLEPATSLLDLLRSADTLPDSPRLRLSSIEPKELTEELIDYLARSHRSCPHLHVPLQSGDDRILKTMNRPYDSTYFEWLVHRIKDTIPEMAIGVDCLVGFPGETDAAFERTCNLIERLPVSYLHVFPFSPQKGTPAPTLGKPVSHDVIKRRCRHLRKLGGRKRFRFFSAFIGSKAQVIFEAKREPKQGMLKGLTANYIPVYMDGSRGFPRGITDVHLDRMENGRVMAKPLPE